MHEVGEWFNAWLVQWGTHSALVHFTHVLAGLLGGALYSVVVTPELRLPRYNRGTHRFELHLLGNLFAGATLGWVGDHSVPVAFGVGLVGLPIITEAILKGIPALVRGFFRWAAGQIDKEQEK